LFRLIGTRPFLFLQGPGHAHQRRETGIDDGIGHYIRRLGVRIPSGASPVLVETLWPDHSTSGSCSFTFTFCEVRARRCVLRVVCVTVTVRLVRARSVAECGSIPRWSRDGGKPLGNEFVRHSRMPVSSRPRLILGTASRRFVSKRTTSCPLSCQSGRVASLCACRSWSWTLAVRRLSPSIPSVAR